LTFCLESKKKGEKIKKKKFAGGNIKKKITVVMQNSPTL
jgi:hypothetical protein